MENGLTERLKELADAVENEYPEVGQVMRTAAETISMQHAIVENAAVSNRRIEARADATVRKAEARAEAAIRRAEAGTLRAVNAARSASAQHGLLLRELSDFGDHLADLTGQTYGEAYKKKSFVLGLRKE
jgi:hypothetical protein